MFVADKRVVGLLLAETIQQGFRILPHLEEVDTASAKVKICPISNIYATWVIRYPLVAESSIQFSCQ